MMDRKKVYKNIILALADMLGSNSPEIKNEFETLIGEFMTTDMDYADLDTFVDVEVDYQISATRNRIGVKVTFLDGRDRVKGYYKFYIRLGV